MQKKILIMGITMGMVMMMLGCQNEEKSEPSVQGTVNIEITTSRPETTAVVETTVEETTAAQVTTQKELETIVEKTTKEEKTTKKEKVTSKKVEKTTKKEKATKKKETKKSDKAIAKKYVGKSLDSLVSAVGKYKTSEEAPSCLYDGEKDGLFYWSDFFAVGHTQDGKWIVDSVEEM